MVEIYRSTVIDAPIEAVWPFLRDFNAHHNWHPAIKESHIESGKLADQVGCVRRFRLQDGAELREQLLSLSDYHQCYSYCIVAAPLPLIGYVATLRLKPVTDSGRTFWEWFSRFTTPSGREQELAELVGESIYQAGFDAVKQRFAGAQGRVPKVTPTAVAARVMPARIPAAIVGETLSCQAIVIDRYGGPDELQWRQVDVPPPGAGEVRLRHTAIGLNYIDIYCRSGYFDLLQPVGVSILCLMPLAAIPSCVPMRHWLFVVD